MEEENQATPPALSGGPAALSGGPAALSGGPAALSGGPAGSPPAESEQKMLTGKFPTATCPICNKIVYRRDLQDHINLHTGDKPWVCKICGKTFRVKKSLRGHVRIHTGEKPFQCNFCQKRFTHKTGLKNHKLTHTKIKRFPCELCGKSFSWKTSLQSHLVTHKKRKNLPSKYQHQCRTCGIGFVDQDCLEKHEQLHEENEDIFLCKHCDKTFASKPYLKRHLEAVHNEGVRTPRKQKLSEGSQNEEADDMSENSESESESSEQQAAKPEEVKRKIVRGRGKSNIDLAAYMEYTGPDTKKPKIGRGKSLKIPHESTVCDVCGMAFKDKTSLKDHLYKHKDPSELPFHCDFCGKGFVKKAYMMDHRVVHTGEKNHVCAYCGKRYATRKSVRDHTRTHTGEKPYKCEICNETFAFRSTYVYHWSTHMDRRLFVCAICDKEFSWGYTYKVHMRQVHQLSEVDIDESIRLTKQSGIQYRNSFKRAPPEVTAPKEHSIPASVAGECTEKPPYSAKDQDQTLGTAVPENIPGSDDCGELVAVQLAAHGNETNLLPLDLSSQTSDRQMFRPSDSQAEGPPRQTQNAVENPNYGYIENFLSPYYNASYPQINQLPPLVPIPADGLIHPPIKHEPSLAGFSAQPQPYPMAPQPASTTPLAGHPGGFPLMAHPQGVPPQDMSNIKVDLSEQRDGVQWMAPQDASAGLLEPGCALSEKDIKPDLDIKIDCDLIEGPSPMNNHGNMENKPPVDDQAGDETPSGGDERGDETPSGGDGEDDSEGTEDYEPGEESDVKGGGESDVEGGGESDVEGGGGSTRKEGRESGVEGEHSGAETDGTEPYAVDSKDISKEKGRYKVRGKKTGESKVQCDECFAWFANLHSLARHHKLHDEAARNPFTCATCQRQFARKKDLRKHEVLHREGSHLYTCSVCGKGFNTRGSLRDHRVVHYDEPTHQCKYCGKLFRHRRTRQEHERVEHIQSKDYICEICGDAFVIPRKLRIHKRKHIDKDSLNCVECGLRFKRKYTLDQHKKLLHVGEITYGCDRCNIVGQTAFWAECHQATHEEEPRQMCEVCGSLFADMANLANHMSMEHKGDRLKCPQCNRTFKNKYTLAGHVKYVHEGQQSYMCDICGQKLSSPSTFEKHMTLHSDIMPFYCKSCNKGFQRKVAFEKHLKSKSHELGEVSDASVFTCEICNKFFGKRELFLKHCKSTRHKILAGENAHRAYHCQVCQCNFLTERNLKTHYGTRKHAENVVGTKMAS